HPRPRRRHLSPDPWTRPPLRLSPPSPPQFRRPSLHPTLRRLRQSCLLQLLPSLFLPSSFRIQHLSQIQPQLPPQLLRAPLHFPAVHFFTLIQLPAHPYILRSLSRKQKRHSTFPFRHPLENLLPRLPL